MPLREVALKVGFSGGVDTKSDPKTTATTRLLALENGVFSKATSIKKRNGYEAIATVSGGKRMATRGDELLVFTSNRSFSLQSNGNDPVDAGAVYSAVPSDRALVMTGTQQTQPDHATIDGITVSAWEDSRGGVWWAVTDEATGSVRRAPAQANASGRSPRCVPCGGNLHIYYAVPSARSIYAIVVVPALPTATPTPLLVIDDLDSTQAMYDVAPTDRTNTPAFIAWFEHASTSIKLGYITGAGALGSPLTGDPSVTTRAVSRLASSPIGVAHSDGSYAYAFVDGSLNAKAAVGDGDTLSSDTPVTVYASTDVERCTVTLTSAGVPWTAWEESAADASNHSVVTGAIVSGAPSQVATLRSVGLASKAWTIDDEAFVCVVHDTSFFNVYMSYRISGQSDGYVPVGRHAPGDAAGLMTRQHLPSAYVTGDVVAVALPRKTRLLSENNDQFTETGIRLFKLDFDNDASHQYAQLGAGLYLAGGCPMHYDGRQWAELGFNVGPEVIQAGVNSGGSMTSNTQYEYIIWYERPDNQGEIHRGPTSPGKIVTMGASDTQVTLQLPTCRLTRADNVRICVARSFAAKTGDTAEFFRVTSLDQTTAGTANGYIANDTTVDTVMFIDKMSDAALAVQEPLYTVGGVLSNDPVALGSMLARGKSRLFATDPSDGNVVRVSQVLEPGYSVEWPPDITIRFDPEGGDITALAADDDRVIAYKREAIAIVTGDGPPANGDATVAGFSRPQLQPTDVGCDEPASLVRTANGFMLKSRKGIQLNNGQQVAYVGAPVEAYNDQTVRRATVMPGRTAVLFLTDSGKSLFFDYFFGQWSTFTNHEGLDAAVVNNQYHYLRSDGRVFRETLDEFSDAGQRIRLLLETAWIHMLDQLQGFQKFWEMHLLGTWISAHQLGVQYQTDYTQGWTDAIWLDATGSTSSAGWITGDGANTIGVESIAGTAYGDGEYGDGLYGGSSVGEYEWRLDIYEEAQSIQFRFQDFEASGFNGASFELTELLLTGGAIANVRRPVTAGRSA